MLLSRLLDGICEYRGEDLEIQRITSSPDQLREGDCFVLLRGVFRDNGHLLHRAIEKRPAFILSEQALAIDIPSLRVENSREVLSRLLYRFYFDTQSPPRLVGITGTNGKSSVCHILAHILKKHHKVGTIGTQTIELDGISLAPQGYTMTTPDPELLYPTLYQMKKMGCEIVVMEISSHALALGKVCPLVFDAAIFTGLSEDHLDFHKTKESYQRAKQKIFSLSRSAVLNTECKAGQEYLASLTIPALTVARKNASFELTDITSVGLESTRFLCQIDNEEHCIRIPLLGEHNAFNAVYALAAAMLLGIDRKDAIDSLGKISKIKGRLEVVSQRPTVILDYAHTPSSMQAVLSYINQAKPEGSKTVVVFGAGGDRDRKKRPLMSRIAEENADFCVLSTDNMRSEPQSQIFADLKRGLQKQNHRFVTDRTHAVAYAYKLCSANDILVLLGKGHEDYILKRNKRIPYSELYALHLAKKGENTNEN